MSKAETVEDSLTLEQLLDALAYWEDNNKQMQYDLTEAVVYLSHLNREDNEIYFKQEVSIAMENVATAIRKTEEMKENLRMIREALEILRALQRKKSKTINAQQSSA